MPGIQYIGTVRERNPLADIVSGLGQGVQAYQAGKERRKEKEEKKEDRELRRQSMDWDIYNDLSERAMRMDPESRDALVNSEAFQTLANKLGVPAEAGAYGPKEKAFAPPRPPAPKKITATDIKTAEKQVPSAWWNVGDWMVPGAGYGRQMVEKRQQLLPMLEALKMGQLTQFLGGGGGPQTTMQTGEPTLPGYEHVTNIPLPGAGTGKPVTLDEEIDAVLTEMNIPKDSKLAEKIRKDMLEKR